MSASFNKFILLIIIGSILGCAGRQFQAAKVATKRDLDYPLSAQLQKIEGEVVVGVFVNEVGKPEEVKIIESSGFSELDTAAYKFASTLTFNPALLENKPIASWTQLILRYKLTEVPFNESRWRDDILRYKNDIFSTQDSTEIFNLQRKLYVNYLGLVHYIEKFDYIEINNYIQDVISNSTKNKWKDFWDKIPAPFAVFDDFLALYPQSELTPNVKEDIVKLLVEVEGRVRIKALKSPRMARTASQLIDLLENRLDELQREEYEKLDILSPSQ